MVLLSVRGTAADGSRSRRPGRATEGRISSCAAQRSAGGLLPARGRVVLRPGGGGGVARALGAPEFGTLPPLLARADRAMYEAKRAGGGAGGSTRTPSRRPIPPSLNPGPGAAAGPATAVPQAWAERQVPNGRIGGPDAR